MSNIQISNLSFQYEGSFDTIFEALCQIGLMSFTKGMGRDRQLFAISALFVISIQLNHSS